MIVTMRLTAEQAYTMMEALEMYSRIHMGQFDQIEYTLQLDTFIPELHRQKYDRDLAKQYLESARSVIFNELVGGAYIGINQTSERSKVSWDLYQQLRHSVTVFKTPYIPLDQRGNAYDKTHPISKEPLPKISVTEE